MPPPDPTLIERVAGALGVNEGLIEKDWHVVQAIAALAPIVDEAVRLVAPRAESARLTLAQDIAPGLPPVRIDLTRVRQVLLNLLSNAIKFTPAGGTVTITVQAREGAVEIAVRDTGIGMAEADIPKALEPFGQISNAMTRAHEGTGLGLPLSKSLIDLHDGQFAITSTPGRGTTVTITLPAETVAPVPSLRGRRLTAQALVSVSE